MPDIYLERLRRLRFRADHLLGALADDLEPFKARDTKLGFRRTPTSTTEHENDVNVTTTCSCLMALAQFGALKKFYGSDSPTVVTEILHNLINAPWKSSGLRENNAFTTTLVLRCYGFLREAGEISLDKPLPAKDWSLNDGPSKTNDSTTNINAMGDLEPTSKAMTPEEIAQDLVRSIDNFKINKYPPASAVVYWFVDGTDRAAFDLRDNWSKLCCFAGDEFRRQRSLVTANHTAMMDPVAMAMAACLCARLHRVLKNKKDPGVRSKIGELPSMIELESSIRELFEEQTPSGLWPKYFPLFHYQDAGSNFCYTYEMLEALLLEFGTSENSTLASEIVLAGLELAVDSCEHGRLETTGPEYGEGKNIEYHGWNSGGNLETLRAAQPESWATAVVHMFLRELSVQASEHIRERLLIAYSAHRSSSDVVRLDKMLDINVRIVDQEESLRGIFKEKLLPTFSAFHGKKAKDLFKQSASKGPLSALLFGPPGTSKTQVAKAIAAELEWPLVEIDPSRFLKNGFQYLYVQAEEIFNDVMDMYGVVILFDELDALVQKRGGATQDTESTFLTTYMLPKLAKLHDLRRSVFLMATNFEDRFDEAIKRSGRFDMLLCMGPPSLEEKCGKIHIFFGKGKETLETKEGGELLLRYAGNSGEIYDQLTLYTFGDFKNFVGRLGNANSISTKLKEIGEAEFRSRVKDDARSVGLRLDDLNLLNQKEYAGVIKPWPWNRLDQLYAAEFQEQDIVDEVKRSSQALRYILERKRSKFQY